MSQIRLFDAVDCLQQIPEYEHEDFCRNALEVGFFCLQRTQIRNDTEFVKRQFDALLSELYAAVGTIPNTIEAKLADKIGTGDGQLLAPIFSIRNSIPLKKPQFLAVPSQESKTCWMINGLIRYKGYSQQRSPM